MIEQIIKEWFKDHKAIYIKHGDLMVLDWKKPGTIIYYIRYVFDGHKMYVSGDMGEAVFWFTEKADVHNQSKYHLGYFEEKLQAYSGNRRDFNAEKAVNRLKKWEKELVDDHEKQYDKKTMKELKEVASGCSSTREWAETVNGHEYNNFISVLDNNYWEWFCGIGDEIPGRIKSYLIGLKMAAEQLREKVIPSCTAPRR